MICIKMSVISLIFNKSCNCTLGWSSGYQGIGQILASYLAACKKQSRIIFYRRAATYLHRAKTALFNYLPCLANTISLHKSSKWSLRLSGPRCGFFQCYQLRPSQVTLYPTSVLNIYWDAAIVCFEFQILCYHFQFLIKVTLSISHQVGNRLRRKSMPI